MDKTRKKIVKNAQKHEIWVCGSQVMSNNMTINGGSTQKYGEKAL